MGYYIFSFGIDANKIKSAFGSKDQAILEASKSTESYDNYSDSDMSFMDGISTEKALEDIIQGNKMDVNSGYAYGYALICMCEAMGERLSSEEIKLSHETDLINKYLQEDFGLEEIAIEEMLFMDDSHSFEIPHILDFPMIGLLTHSALKVLKQMLENVHISNDDFERLEKGENDEKAMIYEHIFCLIQNIDHCVAHNLDLISFCH
jgi:hypothetical protein